MSSHFVRRMGTTAGVLAVAALVLAACGGGSSASGGKSSSGGTNVVNYADPPGPGGAPTYIFPYVDFANCSTVNAEYSYMQYRPLYWFGNNNSPTIDYNYSLGDPPQFSANDTTVTIKIKPWKWSDGETVDARDVIFWMNMLKAVPQDWCSYTPGLFPDNVTSYSAPNAQTVVFHLNKSYNPTWFTYNELSQITPLPLAWDRTSLSQPAPKTDNGHLPDATKAGVTKVYKFLNQQAKDVGHYAKSPLWQVVDGPWHTTSFTTSNRVTLAPNTKYSGSPKPRIAEFVMQPYASDSSEYNVIRAGSSTLQIGYVPYQYAKQAKSVEAEGYTANNNFSFGVNYFPLNMNNPTFGPVFRQLYFRQAFQHLVDQPGWIKGYLAGYGTVVSGPVPSEPPSNFADKTDTHPLYPFSISAAKALLSSHGWKVVPNGTTYCQDPGTGAGQCGAGIPKGLKLSFNLDYASGVTSLSEEMDNLKSDASGAGIQLQLTEHPFNLVAAAGSPCKPTQASCKWTAENWGAGWVYSPGYYPTGESLFQTGAAANSSSWSDPTADALIAKTHTAGSGAQAALNAYQDYIAQQVPVVWQPESSGNPGAAVIYMISNRLHHYTTNAFTYLTPEQWSLSK